MAAVPFSSLPSVSGSQTVKALVRAGWTVARQRGSHVILIKSGELANISVPQHDELSKGTLKSIIQAAGITAEQFAELL